MAANQLNAALHAWLGCGTRLRIIGGLVLLLGLGGAAFVYLTGVPPEDGSADPATAKTYKTGARNLEINYGQTGLLLNNVLEDLKHPGTQAVLILIASALVAAGCFFVAHVQSRRHQSLAPEIPPPS